MATDWRSGGKMSGINYIDKASSKHEPGDLIL